MRCAHCDQEFGYVIEDAPRPGDEHTAETIKISSPGAPDPSKSGSSAKTIASGSDAPWSVGSIIPVGTVLGHFRIEDLLGRGGMGAVYKAANLHDKSTVALKTINSQTDQFFYDRFETEIQAMARLNHKYIVNIIGRGREKGVTFMVIEYVEGTPLDRFIHQQPQNRVKPGETLRIIRQSLEALSYAHKNNIVHRDIKPGNILLDKKNNVKIADFGLAKLRNRPKNSAGHTQTNLIMGTLDYMSPEQRESTKLTDGRADIYSLGVVFYEMLTGKTPAGSFVPPSQIVDSLDERWDKIIQKMLHPDYSRRYQTAEEAFLALSILEMPYEEYVRQEEVKIKGAKQSKFFVKRFDLPGTIATAGIFALVPILNYYLAHASAAFSNISTLLYECGHRCIQFFFGTFAFERSAKTVEKLGAANYSAYALVMILFAVLIFFNRESILKIVLMVVLAGIYSGIFFTDGRQSIQYAGGGALTFLVATTAIYIAFTYNNILGNMIMALLGGILFWSFFAKTASLAFVEMPVKEYFPMVSTRWGEFLAKDIESLGVLTSAQSKTVPIIFFIVAGLSLLIPIIGSAAGKKAERTERI